MSNSKRGFKISGLMGDRTETPTAERKVSGLDLPALDLQHVTGHRPSSGAESTSLIPLELVVRSPYQNRSSMDMEKAALLAEDIRRDGLRNPIIVRPISEGRYELVSGETRTEAFRMIGRSEIPAFIRPMDDVMAARGTVLDNFFHQELTDYEKYKVLKILMDCGAASSLTQLAALTPWGKTHVFRFMSFGKLPDPALSLLESSPSLVSAKVAEFFARLTSNGMPSDIVLDALSMVNAGKVDPHKAADWAEKTWHKSSKKPSRLFAKRAVVLPTGRLICTVSTTPKGLSVIGEKGAQINWDLLEAEITEWLTTRLSDCDFLKPD